MEFTGKDLNKTLWAKQESLIKERKWYRVDATGKTLGRLAVDIAMKLQGKTKAEYCDFWDAGDFVIVDNVEKMIFSGNSKALQKIYYSYSGWKGNVKQINLQELMKKDPAKVLWFAVRGMLPKNKLRDSRMKRLKSHKGAITKYDNFKPVNLYK